MNSVHRHLNKEEIGKRGSITPIKHAMNDAVVMAAHGMHKIKVIMPHADISLPHGVKCA